MIHFNDFLIGMIYVLRRKYPSDSRSLEEIFTGISMHTKSIYNTKLTKYYWKYENTRTESSVTCNLHKKVMNKFFKRDSHGPFS